MELKAITVGKGKEKEKKEMMNGSGGDGFSAENHVHGREYSGITATGEVVSGLEEHLMNVEGTFGGNSYGGENRNEKVVPPVGDPTHLQAGPPRVRGWKSEIAFLHHLKPHPTRALRDVSVAPQTRESVPSLDPLNGLHVLRLRRSEFVSGHPLVRHVQRPRLQNAKHLRVHLVQLRRVAGRFDGVGAVEAVVREGHVEEVAAHHLAEGLQPRFLVVEPRPLDLVLVDGDAHHVGA